jgi:hypothetical protein
MLKFRAVDLHDSIRIREQNFCGRFDYTRLSGTGRPEEQHCADGSVGRIHAGQEYLVEAAHTAHGPLLANDARAQPIFKILRARAFLIRVKKDRFVSLFLWGGHLVSFQFGNHGVYPCRGVLSITGFSPLGILRVIPYAKNAPLDQLMRGKALTFPFRKS